MRIVLEQLRASEDRAPFSAPRKKIRVIRREISVATSQSVINLAGAGGAFYFESSPR